MVVRVHFLLHVISAHLPWFIFFLGFTVQVSLLAPQTLGACDTLVLDATASTGSSIVNRCSHFFLFFPLVYENVCFSFDFLPAGNMGSAFSVNWTLVSYPSSITSSMLNSVVSILQTQSSAGGLLVSIPRR